MLKPRRLSASARRNLLDRLVRSAVHLSQARHQNSRLLHTAYTVFPFRTETVQRNPNSRRGVCVVLSRLLCAVCCRRNAVTGPGAHGHASVHGASVWQHADHATAPRTAWHTVHSRTDACSLAVLDQQQKKRPFCD
jgi:hypothetical protein